MPSILILTRNAGAGFEAVLQGIRAQEHVETPEIVVVDSSSSDGTPELAARYGARVFESIPASAFGHGRIAQPRKCASRKATWW